MQNAGLQPSPSPGPTSEGRGSDAESIDVVTDYVSGRFWAQKLGPVTSVKESQAPE